MKYTRLSHVYEISGAGAVFIAAALPAQEEDAQQDSLQRVHEPVMLKLFSKRAVMSASPFVVMAAL